MYVTESALFAFEAEGDPSETVGAVLSTLNVLEGPALEAVLPARSEAVPEAKEIPIVPSPVQELRETVRVEVPVPLTATVQSAVPVLLSVRSAAIVVTEPAPEYVSV